MLQDGRGLRLADYRSQRRRVCLLDGAQRSEMFQQTLPGACADAGYFEQFRAAIAHLATLAMERHGEAMGFVADDLHQMQNWRMMVERHRFVFLSEDVDDFFALGDRRQRL